MKKEDRILKPYKNTLFPDHALPIKPFPALHIEEPRNKGSC